MPKAQVLVTVTAEALVELPADVTDVEAYCREQIAFGWGDLELESVIQPPAVTVAHFVVTEPEPEPEPESMPVAVPAPVPIEVSSEDTLPLPVSPVVVAEPSGVLELFEDPDYNKMIAAAVRDRVERLLEEVVNQVVVELEPLLHRHYTRNLHGAQ